MLLKKLLCPTFQECFTCPKQSNSILNNYLWGKKIMVSITLNMFLIFVFMFAHIYKFPICKQELSKIQIVYWVINKTIRKVILQNTLCHFYWIWHIFLKGSGFGLGDKVFMIVFFYHPMSWITICLQMWLWTKMLDGVQLQLHLILGVLPRSNVLDKLGQYACFSRTKAE